MRGSEYRKRRTRLFSKMADNTVAILGTNEHPIRNNDAEYPFRADSNFYYLTGFDEPESIAVFTKNGQRTRFILFCRPRNPEQETWTGRRAGTEGAIQNYHAHEAYEIEEFEEKIAELIKGRSRVYMCLNQDGELQRQILRQVATLKQRARSGIQTPDSIDDLCPLVHEQRLIKSPKELDLMRKAADIAARGHIAAMQACRPGKKEYEIQASVEHVFSLAGCPPAYTSIVGGGANTCILHYVENNSRLKDGDLLLIDAGAEHRLYASDITRTFPVNGKFNPTQKAVYELVLKAQQAAITKIKPGNRWDAPHKAAVRVLTRGMVDLGLLKGNLEENIKNESYRRFYMHNTGHWLGMDVHDVGNYKPDGRWRVFKPGMVLTVEPGIYIPAHSRGVPRRFWDIGIRIEDDVVVTRTGNEVITAKVPKSVAEIEALMAQ